MRHQRRRRPRQRWVAAGSSQDLVSWRRLSTAKRQRTTNKVQLAVLCALYVSDSIAHVHEILTYFRIVDLIGMEEKKMFPVGHIFYFKCAVIKTVSLLLCRSSPPSTNSYVTLPNFEKWEWDRMLDRWLPIDLETLDDLIGGSFIGWSHCMIVNDSGK